MKMTSLPRRFAPVSPLRGVPSGPTVPQRRGQSKATGEGLTIDNLFQLNQITNQYTGNHLEF